jgi:polysaccharide biosynthesis transport protein
LRCTIFFSKQQLNCWNNDELLRSIFQKNHRFQAVAVLYAVAMNTKDVLEYNSYQHQQIMVPRQVYTSYNEDISESDFQKSALGEFVKFLTRNYQFIVISVVVFALFGFLSFLFAKRIYKSTSTIKIASYSPLISTASIENTLRQETMENDYRQTQVSNLKSMIVADTIFNDRDIVTRLLKSNGWDVTKLPNQTSIYSEESGGENSRNENYRYNPSYLKSYMDSVTITPVRDTSLVKVIVASKDPVLARDLATAHVNAFIDFNKKEKQKNILENLKFLQNEAEELRNKVAGSERKLATYAQDNKLFTVSKNEDIFTKEITKLAEMKAKASEERINTESLINQIKNSPPEESTVLDDESIRSLRISYKTTEAEYADLKSKFTDEYPKVVQIKAKLETLRESIISQRKQALRGLVDKFKGFQKSEEELAKQIEEKKSYANETSRKLVEYNILEREYESIKDLYQAVLRQIKEFQISAASGTTNITVVEPAFVPSVPSSPNFFSSIILSSLFGLIVSCSILFVKQALDTTIKGVDHAVQALNLPLLGVIPSLSGKNNFIDTLSKNIPEKHLLSFSNQFKKVSKRFSLSLPRIFKKKPNITNPISNYNGRVYTNGFGTRIGLDDTNPQNLPALVKNTLLVEAFRTIRAGLFLSSAEKPPSKILITSSVQNEGKTTIVANFAQSLAQASLRTLVIDTDVRNPALSGYFGIRKQRGLIDFLAGQASLDEIITPTQYENVFVIPAGSHAPNPTELLGSNKMSRLLNYLSESYDHIIIDCAPILPISDALVLSTIVDGTIMVVRSGYTEVSYAKESARRIKGIKSTVLGLIVNDVDEGFYGIYNMGMDSHYLKNGAEYPGSAEYAVNEL